MSTSSESALTPAAGTAGPSRPGALLLDTVLSPRAAFAEIRRDPHWLLPLLLFIAATFFHTMVAMPFTMARITAQMQAMNPSLGNTALARAAETPRLVLGTVSLLSALVTPLLIVLVVAGLVHLLAVLLKGDLTTSGRAVFAASAYASIPLALGTLARVPLILRHKTLDVSLGLDALVPALAQGGGLTRLCQFFDGFRLWYVVLLAVAVAVLYRLGAVRAVAVALLLNALWFGFYFALTGMANL